MIVKAALLLFRDNHDTKEILFVHPKNKPYLVFPGGKQEKDETIEDALQRELQEELGVAVEDVRELGVVDGKTPDGRNIQMHLYSGGLVGDPRPQAEIDQLVWLSKDNVSQQADRMTPMTLDHVLPFLTEQEIW